VSRTVLVSGARAPVALDLTRAFAAAGFAAHLVDSMPSAMANASKAPAAVHRWPSPRRRRDRFRRELARLVERLDPVLVAPTCEEVFHLAAAAPALGLADRLFAPPLETLRRLHAKDSFAALCRALALDAPETRTITDPAGLAALATTAEALVFKPVFSRAGDRTLVRPAANQLARLKPTAADPWIAQDAVAGREVCFYAAVRRGELVAFAPYAPVWQTPGGAGYAFELLAGETAERLRRQAKVIGEVVRTGQFARDAIVDADGRPWLIECNPRATSGVHLFGRGPELARAMLEGEPCEPKPGLRYLSPAMLMFGLPRALARGRLRQLRADLAQGDDAIGAPGDRLPAWGAVVDGIAFQVGAWATGRSLADQMTRDMCWNGEAP
jgi:hypothetical protein